MSSKTDILILIGIVSIALVSFQAYLGGHQAGFFSVFVPSSSETIEFSPLTCESLPCTQEFKIGLSAQGEVVTKADVRFKSDIEVINTGWEIGPLSCYPDSCGRITAQQNCQAMGYHAIARNYGLWNLDSTGGACVRPATETVGLSAVSIDASDIGSQDSPFDITVDLADSLNSRCNNGDFTGDCEASFTIKSDSYGKVGLSVTGWETTRAPCSNCAVEKLTSPNIEVPPANEVVFVDTEKEETPPLPQQNLPVVTTTPDPKPLSFFDKVKIRLCQNLKICF